MFDSLSERLGGILDRLTRRGALTAADVDTALREVRRALLEADVALDVARSLVLFVLAVTLPKRAAELTPDRLSAAAAPSPSTARTPAPSPAPGL